MWLLEELESKELDVETNVNYRNFNIRDILLSNDELLASSGREYHMGIEGSKSVSSKSSWKERIESQKKLLKKQLGGPMNGLSSSSSEFIRDEDLIVQEPASTPVSRRFSLAQKRKLSVLKLSELSKEIKLDVPSMDQMFTEVFMKDPDLSSPWPFLGCAQIFVKFLDSDSWTERHGSFLGLYSLVCSFLNFGSCVASYSDWLFKLSKKTLYVLCTDKFADFVGDRSLIPVREVSAKLLGVIEPSLTHLHREEFFSWIFDMLELSSSWHVIHASLLTFLSILKGNRTSKLDSIRARLFDILESKISSNSITDDDVRYVSLELLHFMFESGDLQNSKLLSLHSVLWNCLRSSFSDENDLSPSLSVLMRLLSQLTIYIKQQRISVSTNMSYLPMVLKLLEFCRHPLVSVRESVYETLNLLLSELIEYSIDQSLYHSITLILIQSLLIENDSSLLKIISLCIEIWIGNVLVPTENELLVKDILRWVLLASNQVYPKDAMLRVHNGSIVRGLMNPGINLGFESLDIPLLKSMWANESFSSSDDSNGMESFPKLNIEREVPRLRNKWMACLLVGTLFSKLPNYQALYEKFLSGIVCGRKVTWYETRLYAIWILFSLCKSAPSPAIDFSWILSSEEIFYKDTLSDPSHLKLSSYSWDFWATSYFAPLGIEVSQSISIPLDSTLADSFYLRDKLLSFLVSLRIQLSENSATVSHPLFLSFSNDLDDYKEVYSKCFESCQKYNRRISAALSVLFLASCKTLPNRLNCLIRPLTSYLKTEPSLSSLAISPIFFQSMFLQDPLSDVTNISHFFQRYIYCDGLALLFSYLYQCNPGVYSKVFANVIHCLAVPHDELDLGTFPSVLSLASFGKSPIEPVLLSMNLPSNYILSLGWPSDIDLSASSDIADSARIHKKAPKELKDLSEYVDLSLEIRPHLRFLILQSDNLFKIFLVYSALWKSNSDALIQRMSTLSFSSLAELKEIWVILASCRYFSEKLYCDLVCDKKSVWDALSTNISSYERFWFANILLFFHLDNVEELVRDIVDTRLNSMSHDNLQVSQVSIECLDLLLEFTPYEKCCRVVVYLIVPILKFMNHYDKYVRFLASQVFGKCVKLFGFVQLNDLNSARLLEDYGKIQGFFSPDKLSPFNMPFKLSVKLRPYQQEGLNWLHFLQQYGLNGILADDMGLGKTLQTLCIIAASHYSRTSMISLIIAPTSVLGHWKEEIEHYVPDVLFPMLYIGTKQERLGLLMSLTSVNVLIASYDSIRNDIDEISTRVPLFHYIVLDEGHVIRNPKSKLTAALKHPSLRSEHRLILSGTPIQNHILDCWCLFDWLLPGYLGSLQQFMMTYGKPILAYKLASFDSKSKEKASVIRRRKENYANALEQLHKLTLPFMLRRLKDDVLDDLPPKSIISYPCLIESNSLQLRLYKAYVQRCLSESFAEDTKEAPLVEEDEEEKPRHIFQILHNLKKLCNHPALLLHPKYSKPNVDSDFWKDNCPATSVLESLEISTKFLALKEILLECGIITNVPGTTTSATAEPPVDDDESVGEEGEAVYSGEEEALLQTNRVLLFCHNNFTLDVIEDLFLTKHFPSISYLRLDSSLSPLRRSEMVKRFQSDYSIQLLLLTTSVGGQGLNLTGANVVIFYENHYNPSVDLQAMDRVHRIGQKQHVSVYRIFICDTFEEKLLKLQDFKMGMVKQVINTQNINLSRMTTKDVMNLLTSE